MVFLKESNNTAIIFDNREISYRETIIGVKSFSQRLDIEKDDRVVIYMENRPELLFGLFAIFDKKGISVNLDGGFESHELLYYLNDCKPKYIITSRANYEKAKKAVMDSNQDIKILIGEDIPHDYTGNDLVVEVNEAEKVLFILYTSGTTGNPKGVMLTYDNLMVNMESLNNYDMYSSSDKVVGILPMHHILPLLGSGLLPLVHSATLIFLKEASSHALIEAMQKYKVTIIVGVPKLWEMMHKKIMEKINSSSATKSIFKLAEKINNKSFSKKIFKKVHDGFGGHLRFFVAGGSKLSETVARDFKTLGVDVLEGYGLTETSPMISFTPINKVIPGCAGEIIPGVEVKIADDGEILVRGRNVMKGYYNKPEATAEVIRDGWFSTGDLGRVEGIHLYVTGRKKEMIVLSNGKNINPLEIEEWISTHSDLIKEVAIIDYEDKLTALIHPNFAKLASNNITNILETFKMGVIDEYNKKAPSYKKILDIKIIQDEFPKTKIGKVRRFMLKDLLKENNDEVIEIIEPDTREYKEISNYIYNLKGRRVIPSAHLELDLGLDSLEIVELLSYIEGEFGVKVEEKDLADNQTVEKLAGFVLDTESSEASGPIKWKELLTNEDIDASSLPTSNFVTKIVRAICWPILTFYIKVKKINPPTSENGPVIFVGNHQSFLDGFLLNHSFNSKTLNNTYYFAKSKHFSKQPLKYMGNNGNIILVDINKNLVNSLQLLGKALKQGHNIVIFPEGTRTRNGNLGKFKKFFAILSKELEIPVIPFVIKNAYELYPPNKKFPSPGTVSIEFLDKIYPDKNLSHEEYTQKIHDLIEKSLEN